MRFDRETWRKLYVVESAQHRLLPVFTRGLRDYLLRLASEDGSLLVESEDPRRDFLRLLNADPGERKQILAAFDQLLRIGYLSLDGGRLWITRFVDAQAARSPGAKRQEAYKRKKQEERSASPEPSAGDASGDAPGSVSGDASGDASVTSQIDETRRDETTYPRPPAASAETELLAVRAAKILLNPLDGDWDQPSKWPETIAVAEAWGFGMTIRLRNNVNGDADLRAILEAFRDKYPLSDLIEAGNRARRERERGDGFFAAMKRPGPAAFTAAVLRRLLADDEISGVTLRKGGDETGGYGSAADFVR
jgi:hypothetical protein